MLKAAFSAVLASGIFVTVTAFAAPPTISGGMAVDAHGMTLYTFDKDRAGNPSACTEGCTQLWPAALAEPADQPSGDWSLVSTGDGSKQWAYKGKRVYTFQKDQIAGATNGDNFKNVWHTVKP